MKERGKFIVIEGGDSSGKEVQSVRLRDTLVALGYQVRFLDFPRYDEFHGKVVGRYLAGEFGDTYEVSPYLAAYPYAMDRLELKDSIVESLEGGQFVVSNRYVGSNIGYMSGKLPEEEREEFVRCLEDLEYTRNRLPREDVSIFLHVSAQVGQRLTYQKDEKVYMRGRGRGDIHERNLRYLQSVIHQFIWLTQNRGHWALIECMKDDQQLKPIEQIHDEIIRLLIDKGIIPDGNIPMR